MKGIIEQLLIFESMKTCEWDWKWLTECSIEHWGASISYKDAWWLLAVSGRDGSFLKLIWTMMLMYHNSWADIWTTIIHHWDVIDDYWWQTNNCVFGTSLIFGKWQKKIMRNMTNFLFEDKTTSNLHSARTCLLIHHWKNTSNQFR